METKENWPIVEVNDHGIRPAGPKDECFYCYQKVGTPHRQDCVIVVSAAMLLVTIKVGEEKIKAIYLRDFPVGWSDDACEFQLNEGTWCADNMWTGPLFFYSDEDAARAQTVRYGDPVGAAVADLEGAPSGCCCFITKFKVIDRHPQIKRSDAYVKGSFIHG